MTVTLAAMLGQIGLPGGGYGIGYDPDFNHPVQRGSHGNPNVLTHGWRTSRLLQGPAAHSALVRVEKVDGDVPEVRAFEPLLHFCRPSAHLL